jgi:hypothetical protein
MKQPLRELTVDAAVAELQALVDDTFGDTSAGPAGPPQTPEEAEATRFRTAEFLIGLACPDPGACADQRCRRDALCRHLAHLRDRQKAGTSHHPRRTAGAEAVRYASWVLMSSQAEDEAGRAPPERP